MNATHPSADTLIADPLYARLKEHVVGRTGLNYYQDRDADLAWRIGRRLAILGDDLGIHDCASYLGVLRDPVRGPRELDELVAEITIGETAFFRHPEHFDALRDTVLPDLIARNLASRRLRIWCAGCADGAEPYSLAILLNREMGKKLLGWNVTILGTDLNRHRLVRAREGRFEEWALRSTPEDVKNACFSQEGKFRRILPEYRAQVSFQYHNLVEHPFPSLLNNLFSFDLVVCRNVMIYFGAELMRKMILQFHQCLSPEGWLLVGPTEPNMMFYSSFHPVNAPGVTLYRKPGKSVPSRAAPALPALPPLIPAPPATQPLEPTLAEVRRHADCGAWESASRCCEQLLQKDNLNSAVHFFHALVLDQMRKHAEAEASLRRAIYLDRKSVLPHYYLGLSLQARGHSHEAAKSFENALDLLLPRHSADIFPDADGITVAEMRKLAQMHLDILRKRA